MKIAAAYIRVSTEEQTELSPDSQIKLIRDYAKKNNYILPDEFIFQDDGISGRTTAKRPAFNRMIGIAKQKPKPFDSILLWKFSRFARNREDSIVYKSMLRKQCGIDVISITENVGDDKMSILIEALIEAMDEYYSINLAEEVRRGMSEKFYRGQKVTAPPLGYDMQNNHFVINENEAKIIKFIFESYNNGMGCVNIARKLNADGYRTKYNKNFENRTVEYILRNPIYVGKQRWTPGGGGSRKHYNNTENDVIIVDGDHEAIIAKSEWDKAQDRIRMNKERYGKYAHNNSDSEYVLKGLVRCSDCGSTLTRAGGDGLQCYKYAHGKCNVSHYVSTNVLMPLIIDNMQTALITDDIAVTYRSAKSNTNKSNLQRLINAEKTKLERAKNAYLNGIDTIDEYKSNKKVLTQNIEQLESKLSESENITIDKPAAIKNMREKLKSVISTLQSNASPAIKNDALKTVIDKIIFDRTKSEITIFYFCD